MDRYHQWDRIIQLSQNPPKMGVPGVTVDDISVYPCRIKVRTSPNRAKDLTEVLRRLKCRGVYWKTMDFQIRLIDLLIAERPDINLHNPGKFAAEILNMNSRAAVSRGWVFVR